MDVNVTKHVFLTIDTDGKEEKNPGFPLNFINMGRDRDGSGRKWCLVTTAWLKENFTPYQASTDATLEGRERHFLTALYVASLDTVQGHKVGAPFYQVGMTVPLSHGVFFDTNPKSGGGVPGYNQVSVESTSPTQSLLPC